VKKSTDNNDKADPFHLPVSGQRLSMFYKGPSHTEAVAQFHGPKEKESLVTTGHGTKGVIARVIPDDEMPKDESGEKLEVLISPSVLHNRMNKELFHTIYGADADWEQFIETFDTWI